MIGYTICALTDVIRLEDPRADGELIEDFWPASGA